MPKKLPQQSKMNDLNDLQGDHSLDTINAYASAKKMVERFEKCSHQSILRIYYKELRELGDKNSGIALILHTLKTAATMQHSLQGDDYKKLLDIAAQLSEHIADFHMDRAKVRHSNNFSVEQDLIFALEYYKKTIIFWNLFNNSPNMDLLFSLLNVSENAFRMLPFDVYHSSFDIENIIKEFKIVRVIFNIEDPQEKNARSWEFMEINPLRAQASDKKRSREDVEELKDRPHKKTRLIDKPTFIWQDATLFQQRREAENEINAANILVSFKRC